MTQLDSIEIPTTAIDQKMEELDSLVDRYSLNKGEVVTDSMDNLIEKAVSAVASQIDSLQRIIEKPLEHPKKVVNRADSLLNGITGKVKKLQNKLGSETGLKSSPGQDTNLNSLFDQCDIINQQNLLKGLPSLNELKSANFQKSIKGLGISDDISSKLPDGISDNINQLAGTGNLNSYLNDQLRQMGCSGHR
jgi:phage-related protein